MADDSAEIDPGLLENVQLAIRNNIELNFAKKVKIEFKGDRTEGRILALSIHRLYVLTSSKNGCKVESSMHILEIQKIESSKPLQLTIHCGEKPFYIRVLQPQDCIEIIAHIVASLKTNFPSGNPDRLLRLVFGPPEESGERQAQVTTLVNNFKNTEGDAEIGPCGGFSKVYVSMCDFYGQPHLEEVVWDIDTIYLSLNTRVLNIQDFDHLDQKDLVPLIATLEFNEWFTKVSCDSFKLGSEVCDAIVRVIKKSCTLEELVLEGISYGRDFCQKLALSLMSNPKTSLHSFSLAGNSIEDRGVTHLAGALGKLPHGLVSVCLADNGITSKGASTLGQALGNNKYNESSLKRLDLCKNQLKADGVPSLCEFLAKPNMLTQLDLASTECPLDLLFGALLRGCVQHLASVNLAGNSFTSKKTKDYVVPPSFKEFFSTSQALKSLDVSDCKLHADAIRAILEGLHKNHVVSGVDLNISKNDLRGPGAKAITETIGNLRSVTSLDISDNGFEMDLIPVLNKLSSNKHLKHLNMGQNSRQRSSVAVMESLVQLISLETSQLDSISLADSRLKQDIIPFLDALGTNETLKQLDISGNQMGDEGARILAKALQINTKLRTLLWDRNGTTFRGFADIASALECNHILLSMPMPLQDAAQSLKPQTEQHIRKIEKLLLRNQSPHKVVTEQAYRLQQGLLLASTQQQMVDRLVVQLHDLMNGLRSSKDPEVHKEVRFARLFVQDADNLKQLLLKFHLCTSDSDIEARFAELTAEFYQAAQDKMKNNVEKMIECAKEVCPNITSAEDVVGRLQTVAEGKARLSETFVEEIILTRAAAGITKKLSEDKLTAASFMADTMMEMVLRQLENSATKLELLFKDHLKRRGNDEKEIDNSKEEDDVATVARKARNRLSSVQLTVPSHDGIDGKSTGGRSHKRRPTVSRRPTHGATIPEERDGATKEEVVITQNAVKSKTLPKPAVHIDFADMEPKASDLKHLVKDRARPPQKRRLPTRPSNRPAVTNGTAHDDKSDKESIEVFWSSPAAEPEVVAPVKTSLKTSKSKSPPSATTPPAKTAPPKPAPKPKPSPKPRESEETKKSWIPRGGINLGVPGFFKKKAHRDRAQTSPHEKEEKPTVRKTSASAAWYTTGAEKESEKTHENQAPAKVEIPAADEKSKEHRERVPSEKKLEVSKEKDPAEKNLRPSEEKAPQVIIQETAISVNRERTALEGKREINPSKPKPDGAKPPTLGLKPFGLPRDRTTSGTPTKGPSPQPRDRAATTDLASSKEPVKPYGPPKFGVGIGGAAGGGLLAEMKMRQERAASLGRGKTAEKAVEGNKADESDGVVRPRLTSGGREAESEITKEGLVKPSSFKKPKVLVGPPPKPAPRPDRKESRKVAEKAEEKKEGKVEESKEKTAQVRKEETKGAEEDKLKEEVNLKTKENVSAGKNEEPQEKQETEEKEAERFMEQEQQKENAAEEQKKAGPPAGEETKRKLIKETKKTEGDDEEKDTKNEQKSQENVKAVSESASDEQKDIAVSDTAPYNQGSMDDLWIKRPSGKESLRPGGRSQSVKVQRSTSGSDKAPGMRSATLPKPWSPGEAPANTLARKLSWEMPKVKEEDGVKGGKKERNESKGEAIQEVPEEQILETSATASKGEKDGEIVETSAEKENGQAQAPAKEEDSVFSSLTPASPISNETQL